ncbi:MAG: class II aldolase/adducin family protein [Clostridia bacterium]|nr:class II aldolase/adducin family protein [Clostridia bacterium]
MNFELMHPADQIVTIMERIYACGMTTTSGGNLSVIDENGDIWITPGSVDKGSLTRDDIVRVTPSGEIIGKHNPSCELPFHTLLYKTRPDIKAILHAHPPALVSYSIVRKVPNSKILSNISSVCGKIGIAGYDIPGSIKLGENIAKVFTDPEINTVMMDNHGVVVGHTSLFRAFMGFETFEYCARLEINSRIVGTPRVLSDKNIEAYETKAHPITEEFVPEYYSSDEKAIRRDMVKLIRRAYTQRLFSSTQGTFSQRIDDNSFVITPYNKDRFYLEPEDLVTIRDGKKEAGKFPSRSALLHKYVYEKHPEINSVIIAYPHNVMAFAATDAEFDSRTIPESYIQLRNVVKLPFGSSFMQPEMTADTLSPSTPVALVDNDCLIATGTSLINAFDRLEVAEYTAMAIITSKQLGEIVKINDEQVQEINEAFNLQ